MEVSVSIEPYLVLEKAKLIQYIEKIVKIGQKEPRVTLHFDYFIDRPDLFAIVQSYARQIPIYAHIMQQNIVASDFRVLSVDVRDYPKQPNATGIVFDLGTELTGYENLIKKVRYITVMTVKCGKSGQTFNPEALQLLPQIRQINPQAIITVDGGINDTNIDMVRAAGADIAVVGSYLQRCDAAGDLLKGINRLLHV